MNNVLKKIKKNLNSFIKIFSIITFPLLTVYISVLFNYDIQRILFLLTNWLIILTPWLFFSFGPIILFYIPEIIPLIPFYFYMTYTLYNYNILLIPWLFLSFFPLFFFNFRIFIIPICFYISCSFLFYIIQIMNFYNL